MVGHNFCYDSHMKKLILFIVLVIASLFLYSQIRNNTPTKKLPPELNVYVDPTGSFGFQYPVDWYYENVPGFPTNVTPTNISFFFAGTEVDHTFGDHEGNELLNMKLQKDTRTLEKLKDQYSPQAENIILSSKPAIKTSFGMIETKLSEDLLLTITGKGATQILGTLEFSQ
jgi:hypothetical protein